MAQYVGGNTNEYEFYPELAHIQRDLLLEELHVQAAQNRHTVISSPAGTGKTSLLKLFQKKYSEYRYINVNFVSNLSADEILQEECGISVLKSTISDGGAVQRAIKDKVDKTFVVIDDAQEKYNDSTFWYRLVKVVAFLPASVHFIICAPRSLSVQLDNPVDLAAFKFPASLLLSDTEAAAMLNLPYITGLRHDLKSPVIQRAIIIECAGNVGALRMSINGIHRRFAKSTPTAVEVLQYYLSGDQTTLFARCFGNVPNTAGYFSNERLLVSMFSGPQDLPQGGHPIDDLLRLEKCGIVQMSKLGTINYASPAAMRYVAMSLFPSRVPGSQLSDRAGMSACALADTTPEGDLAKEELLTGAGEATVLRRGG